MKLFPSKGKTPTRSFEELLSAHLDALYRASLCFCGGRSADAEDLLQDAALRAFCSFASLNDSAAGRSWLFKILLRTHLNRARAAKRRAEPQAARERLFTALARERLHSPPPPSLRRQYYRWFAATGVAVALVVTWFVLGRKDHVAFTPPVSAVAEDHMRGLHQSSIETSDPPTLQRWIGEHVPFRVRILDIHGAELRGARICFVDGERGVTLNYSVNDRPVSYYVMPGRGARELAATGAFQEEVDAGYRVVAWQDAGLTHALVSDLSPDVLNELARSCAAGMTSSREPVVSCGIRSGS